MSVSHKGRGHTLLEVRISDGVADFEGGGVFAVLALEEHREDRLLVLCLLEDKLQAVLLRCPLSELTHRVCVCVWVGGGEREKCVSVCAA